MPFIKDGQAAFFSATKILKKENDIQHINKWQRILICIL
ncbi:hypothetical protein CHK_0322 [Christensenella hongkongensis]|uniref:Uncharacterized protein n=1 Tax=Christensenella hongkongensis TaxID=270498 RepID=A0A0M2NI55_9FIRM|nr:hypothetical protein CHK_0322 [Christensenella hongkongensis]